MFKRKPNYETSPPNPIIKKSVQKRNYDYSSETPRAMQSDCNETTYKTFYEYVFSTGILEQFMRTRNQGGIGLWYRPARLHRLADSNRFLGYLKV
jgi:hypothetical protein